MSFEDDISGTPMCVQCGEGRVGRVTTSRPPRFKGARGPYADGEPLPGVAVEGAAPKGPLLKDVDG